MNNSALLDGGVGKFINTNLTVQKSYFIGNSAVGGSGGSLFMECDISLL